MTTNRSGATASRTSILLTAMFSAVIAAAVCGDEPVSDSQKDLPLLLKIDWKVGPSLPQGFQDSDGGIIDDTLITTCGFCSGQSGIQGKDGKYPRNFLNKTWGLNLESPKDGWKSLPDFPGSTRQENAAIVVDNQLYSWGGFSYHDEYCYEDGYVLSHSGDQWTWKQLPDLPWRISTGGICAIGSKIYIMGGADYDKEQFYTNADRTGKTKRIGARMLVFDTRNPGAGWKELKECPGTPRWVHAVTAVNGQVYVIGGGTGGDNPTGSYCTVVDNWRYDPAKDQWHRLKDLPISSGNFPSGSIVYDNRYIVLIGGYQYPNVLHPDGSVGKPYGKPFQHYTDKSYYSDVFVYDTKTDTFGQATPLPLNNNLPMTVINGDTIHLIGGETNGAVIEAEHFGHHPDLYLVGKITKAKK